MYPVVTAAEMQALDRATIDEVGIPGFTLMETAGRAVAVAALALLDGGRGPVAVVCGPGNNGGDGYVVARALRAVGVDATVYLVAPRDKITGDARAHLVAYETSGGVVTAITTREDLDAIGSTRPVPALVVDALFGVGLSRPVEGFYAAVIEGMNRAPAVLAVDIPSGLHADTGEVLGVSVRARATVAMAARKVALVSAPGFAHCGEIAIAEIGIPQAMLAATARAGLVEPTDIARWLPAIDALDHKGRRGHVLVVGGQASMRGASRLAATAALRAGAGLVTLAGEGEVTAPDSVMTADVDALADALKSKAAVVIGPGLGQSAAAQARVDAVLAAGIPAVLDADALNLVAADPAQLARAAGPVVITPHPGEAARLLGIATADVERDRLAAARKLAAVTRAVVVLKGARTIVCDGTLGDDFCAINPTGGPALATAGSGDVLAGVMGALLAQGVPAGDAARTGVYLHGAAGDALQATLGRGVISSDLPLAIAEVAAKIRA